METANLYELLSVQRGALDDEIKRAYYAMVEAYHPDRHHHLALKHAQGLLEELLGKIAEAYKTLSEPGSRRRYDGNLHTKERAQNTPGEAKPPEPKHTTIPPEVIASRQYQQGKKHFKQMEYFDAIQCLRESVRLSGENVTYRKLLAICLAKNPKWREEAESYFREVLEADQFHTECRIRLAEMYEASNLKSKANREYEAVLAYDPENTIAKKRLHTEGDTSAASKFQRVKTMLNRAVD